MDSLQHKAFVGRGRVADVPVILAKPQTFMNVSGDAVGALARFYKVPPARLLVVYDDLDLEVSPAMRVLLLAQYLTCNLSTWPTYTRLLCASQQVMLHLEVRDEGGCPMSDDNTIGCWRTMLLACTLEGSASCRVHLPCFAPSSELRVGVWGGLPLAPDLFLGVASLEA